MPIKILAIGKKHESWVSEGVQRYQKRLRSPFTIEWVLLPHSSLEGNRARQEESERILLRLNQDEYVILLDEQGKLIDSPLLSTLLGVQLNASRTVVLVIGGAYGVDELVYQRASYVWSLSPLVFPHQLVRLMLLEQLYRAQQIRLGSAYHHE
ncbi:MAG: 23S rRNA (pseudouridine(1915)-N(3))-methyltransferase RlmH [Candidatus Saccharimonadaceae bacterium]